MIFDRFRRRKSWIPLHAPQKQCKDRVPHVGHHWPHQTTALIWWCQGRKR